MCSSVTYIFVLVAVTHGFAGNSTESTEKDIPKLIIFAMSLTHIGGPIIDWLPMKYNGHEPILGYKVKLWEVGCITKLRSKEVNGEIVLVRERVMPEFDDHSTLHNLEEFTLEGVNNTSLFLENLPTDIPYLVRAAAYSATNTGPLSSPIRFQVEGTYKCKE